MTTTVYLQYSREENKWIKKFKSITKEMIIGKVRGKGRANGSTTKGKKK